MALWTSGQLDALREAAQAGRAGTPTLLIVEGEAGTGKSTLLDHLEDVAEGFVVAAADGVESSAWPFEVLIQWGVPVDETASAAQLTPFLVAQRLRETVDRMSTDGPVLLRLDDCQWADRESLEALSWLLRRASGDRLLVAVATRPVPTERHLEWSQLWAGTSSSQISVTLAGLAPEEAFELVQALRPGTERMIATRLWEHTSGNPLYLGALLRDYDAASLSKMRSLPAPAEYADLINARLSRLGEPCVALARACAVLGSGGWVSLLDAAAVAFAASPSGEVQVLQDAGLVEIRTASGWSSLRYVHSLMRAAVYQHIPLAERRALHAAAADVVSTPGSVLEHRMAAAEQYDEVLADDLETYSKLLRGQSSFRLAAQYLRWASVLTAGRAQRGRRWLDSLFNCVLAREIAVIRREVGDVQVAQDQHRAALILGGLAVIEGRWNAALTLLADVVSAPLTDVDQLVRYQSEVLWAWAGVGAGASNERIEQALGRAAATGEVDPAVAGYALLAGGQVAARSQGTEALLLSLPVLPERPAVMPLDQTYLLSWRGALRAHTGFLPQALADLREAQNRIQTGFVDVLDGGTHAFLGQTFWMAGQWDLAAVCLRLATDVATTFLLPLTRAYLPLLPAGSGDFIRADELLNEAFNVLEDLPWQEAIQALLVAEVVRLHASDDDPDRRASLLTKFRSRWPAIHFQTGLVSSVWLVHYGLAAVWSGDLEEARASVQRMSGLVPQAPWVPAAVEWLTGLIEHALGNQELALDHLRTATRLPFAEMPFYRAHLLTDYGRLAVDQGIAAESELSLREAEGIYARLRASAHLTRLARIRAMPLRHKVVPAPKVALTEREKDILALVVAGMSYRQVARDLFITESTVSYHLGNIYAKAAVKNRHQLTDVVRKDPAFFGLVLAPV